MWNLNIFRGMFWKFKSKNMSSDLRPFEFIIYIQYQALSHIGIIALILLTLNILLSFLASCKLFTKNSVWDGPSVCYSWSGRKGCYLYVIFYWKATSDIECRVHSIRGHNSRKKWVALLNEYPWHVLIYTNIHAYKEICKHMCMGIPCVKIYSLTTKALVLMLLKV